MFFLKKGVRLKVMFSKKQKNLDKRDEGHGNIARGFGGPLYAPGHLAVYSTYQEMGSRVHAKMRSGVVT